MATKANKTLTTKKQSNRAGLRIPGNIMKTYTVSYTGNATRFQGFSTSVRANSKRESVEKVYAKYLDANYFPDDSGRIFDCDNNLIALSNDDIISYDGGYFYAVEESSLHLAREIVKELNKLYNEEIFVIDDYNDESDEVRIINAEYRYEGNDLHIRVESYGTIKVSVTGISEQTFYGVADLLHAIDSIFSNENPD